MPSRRPQLRRQTAAVLVRMLPEEKAELDALVPRGEVGSLIRRLLEEYLTQARTVRSGLAPADTARGETTAA